ncbi:MAG: PqqD family peptide modification chaperone [Proteobacteria bacterium]|nr:PqqD family peptide modification chaperone [Pseudomonadota bacterium]
MNKIKIPEDIFERIEEENLKKAEELISKGLYEEAEDIGVMTLIRSGIMTQLNPMGKIIWDNLRTINTLNDLVEKISKEFNIDYESCFRDIKIFIDDLIDKGFIVYE